MKQSELIISDTNILIDLFQTNLLKDFFSLPYKIKTTTYVITEIVEAKQLEMIKPFIDSNKLEIVQPDEKTFHDLMLLVLVTPGDLSIADCSVWQEAKKTHAKLLTSDKNLKKAAEKDNVVVHGCLFVFDELIKHGKKKPSEIIAATKHLISLNERFPKKLAQEKIKKWISAPLDNVDQTMKKSPKSSDDDLGPKV